MLLIIFILLTCIAISTAIGSNFSRTCVPFRCGNQEISYPFRLQGDPSDCGIQSYELLCHENRTFLRAPYDKYLVTNVDYHNNLVHIVDTGLATGNCNLPFQALTHNFFPHNFTLAHGMKWVVFMNCSHKITESNCSDYNGLPYMEMDYCYYINNGRGHTAIIPCLSQNKRFIYVIEDIWLQRRLTSCTYMTMVPIKREVDVQNIGDDIFRILKQGFSVSWPTEINTRYMVIRYCLGKASDFTWLSLPFFYPSFYAPLSTITQLLDFECGFLFCIWETRDFALFGFFIVSTVFLNIAVIVTFVRLIIAPLCVYVFLLFELKKLLSPIDSIETFLRNQDGATPTRYAYSDIVAMTSHFKDRLGQGGFGTVYKGELPGGYLVAIKLLGKSNDNGEDFISEVSTIGMIHHINIVRLVGFCSEGLHRALVYEYMYNGSLDKYIFSSTQKFSTKKLHEIALGVARGIDYLHRGCDMRILHFDIKPHNILLDSNFNPKVSDFGLAKLYPKNNSLVSAFAARGTIGYMAPELISRSFGIISYKSDVYSFGMLLLEMVGGRRNYDSRVANSGQAYFPSWIYDQLNQRTYSEVLEVEVEIEDVESKLCKVGLWCIQMVPSARPSMIKVIEMLEGDVDDVETPPKPFFFSSSQSTTREQNLFELSFNEISTIYDSE